MAVRVSLLLLCVLLYVAGAQDVYNDLPVAHRKSVDHVMERVNSTVPFHLRFFGKVNVFELESGPEERLLYHHFYLKTTQCNRGTPDPNPQNCPFRENVQEIDCAFCGKVLSDEIQPTPEPYFHCIQKLRLTEEMKSTRTKECSKITYSTGSASLVCKV